MAAPVIVQSANARANSGTPSITLTSTPTTGNLLVLFVIGHYGGTDIPAGPAGMILSDAWIQTSNEGVRMFTRVVQSGDSKTWTIGTATDYNNLLMLELSGVAHDGINPFYFNSNRGNATAIGKQYIQLPIVPKQPSDSLRFVAIEVDGAVPMVADGSWTLVSPAGWNPPGTGNHAAAIWTIPPGTTNQPFVSSHDSPNIASPIYMDVAFYGTVPSVVAPILTGSGFARGKYRPPPTRTSPQWQVSVGPGIATPGNWHLVVCIGFNGALTPDGSLTLLSSASGDILHANQKMWVFVHKVQIGDSGSYTFQDIPDMMNLAAFEFSGVTEDASGNPEISVQWMGGTLASGTSWTGISPVWPIRYDSFIIGVTENDGIDAVTYDSRFTQLDPGWIDSDNHSAAVFQIPWSYYGAFAVTYASAPSQPVGLFITINGQPSVAYQNITLLTEETWYEANPAVAVTMAYEDVWYVTDPNVNVTLFTEEVWYVGSPAIRVSTVLQEVWMDLATPFVPPPPPGAGKHGGMLMIS